MDINVLTFSYLLINFFRIADVFFVSCLFIDCSCLIRHLNKSGCDNVVPITPSVNGYDHFLPKIRTTLNSAIITVSTPLMPKSQHCGVPARHHFQGSQEIRTPFIFIVEVSYQCSKSVVESLSDKFLLNVGSRLLVLFECKERQLVKQTYTVPWHNHHASSYGS